ncbi:MAG: hypothetical protein NBKEAIPA_00821 [Nitrospirae bacterium]|nr:MAG: hypothetical protein UZ03_NOB001001142 [Nitrospira sp. OLB3]MBV6468942.1 hypothetical protein [Nitrospirota bacterium]MCE7966737.1 hypothetical protein [Nitrospira sp. NTP2]MCK6493676.1 hypothetical protein [Nitrospira sp.]MEB2338221.1 hypothetical protein [Nitrospirales bacterium]
MKYATVLLALLILTLNACAFSRGTLGDELKTETINSIKKGVTTRAEVLAKLGAPDRIVQLNGRDLFQYYRYDAKVGSLLLIILNFSRVTIKSDDLFVLVDRDGVVEEVIASKRTEGLEFRFWPFGD